MTALCPGGGPSGPKPLPEVASDLTATAVGALIKRVTGRDIGAFANIIAAGVSIVNATFCASDPPADPGVTQADWDNVTAPPDPVSYLTSSRKVIQWFLHWYWGQVCECTGAVTPVITPGPLPTGTGTNVGLPDGNLAGSCWNVTTAHQYPADPGPGSTDTFADFNSSLLPAGPSIPLTGQPAGAPQQAIAIPSNTNTFTVTLDVPSGFAGPQNYTLTVVMYDSAGTQVGGTEAIVQPGQPPPQSFTLATLPANAAYWAARGIASNQPIISTNNTFSFNCTGVPPNSLQTPCCPPDPITQQNLQLILNIVSQLYTNPPGAPLTGWADGIVHAGLSGTGSFQLAHNVSGIRANFTTIPSNIRVTPGTPTFYWDLGFVTPVAAIVPLRSLRTVFQAQAMSLPVQTTAIDYTFPPGVVVTLTELLPA